MNNQLFVPHQEYLEKFGYYGLGQHQQADVNHDGDGTSRDQQLHVLPGQHSEADREKAVRSVTMVYGGFLGG